MGVNSKAEVKRRVADIYGLVVDGLPHGQICRYVAANCSWKASERTICRYIALARELMTEQAKVGRKEVFAESLARKQRLYARASTANQLKTALAVQNSIDRMFGDFADQRDEASDLERFLEAMLGPREGWRAERPDRAP
jgi:hypothetical protein